MSLPSVGRKDSRRGEILQAAARVFAERGFMAATIRDVAREAEMLSGSLYYHFQSKEQIAEEILEQYWVEIFACTDEILQSDIDAVAKLAALIEQTLLVDGREYLAVRLLVNDWQFVAATFPTMPQHMNDLEAKWISVLRAGIAQGMIRADLDPALIYRSIMASINGMTRWFRPGKETPMSRIAQTQVALWLEAVRPLAGPAGSGSVKTRRPPAKKATRAARAVG